MAILSVLRSVPKASPLSLITKNGGQTRLFHEGEFPMRPSIWSWRKFKDELHFYIMLGVIPLTLFTTYVNIRIGPAELAETPEGYEPKHWEYFKNPVPRLMAKYLIGDKRVHYEGFVDYYAEYSERAVLMKMEDLIKDFMKGKHDYQSWYYRPMDAYNYRFDREEWKYMRDVAIGEKDYVVEENTFSDGGNPK